MLSKQPLKLEDLSSENAKRPSWNKVFGDLCAQAASMCIEDRGHSLCVEIEVDGDYNEKFELHSFRLTETDKAYHNDMERSAEFGAYGLSALIIPEITDYTIIEVAKKGTGFDFWLGPINSDENILFQNKARLEVSGILSGDKADIQRRVSIKLKQISRSRVSIKLKQISRSDDQGLPGYVSVVEFGSLLVRVVRKKGVS